MPQLARTAPGRRPVVAVEDLPAVGLDLLGREAEEADQVGVGAEAAVADADGPFGAQAGRHQRVGHALDREGADGQGLGVEGGTEQADAVDGGQTGPEPAGQGRLVGPDGVPADAGEGGQGGLQGDGADDVRGAGLLAFGRLGPDHLVEVDEVDGPAAGQEGVALGEGGPGADEDAGAVGGVHLVAGEGQVVRPGRQGPVGGELGGVEDDGHPTGVGRLHDGRQWGQPAGDVGGAGQGEQAGDGPSIEAGDDVVGVEGAVGGALHVAAGGQRGPRAGGWRGARRRW